MNCQFERPIMASTNVGNIAPTPIGSTGLVTVVDSVNIDAMSWFGDAELCSLISSSLAPSSRKRSMVSVAGDDITIERHVEKKLKYDPLVDISSDDKFLQFVDDIEEVESAPMSIHKSFSIQEEPFLRRISHDDITPITIESMPFVHDEVEGNHSSALRRVSASSTDSSSTSMDAAKVQEESSAPPSKTKIRRFQFEQWTLRYNNLKKFQAKHGHCLVNESHDDHDLAKWVKRQRYQYKLRTSQKHSTMTAQRIEALEGIGFIWNPHKAAWEERFNELLEFKRVNGHCNVPCTYDNQRLSSWVQAQRRQAKLSTLDSERFQRLANAGFEWKAPTNTKRRSSSASASPCAGEAIIRNNDCIKI